MAYRVNYLGQYGWVVVDDAGQPVSSVYENEAAATAAATTLTDQEKKDSTTTAPAAADDRVLASNDGTTSMTDKKVYDLGGGYTLVKVSTTSYSLDRGGSKLVSGAEGKESARYIGGEYVADAGGATVTYTLRKDGKTIRDVEAGAAQNLITAYKTLQTEVKEKYGDTKGELVSSDPYAFTLSPEEIENLASGKSTNSSGDWLSSNLFNTTYSPYQPGEGEEWYISGYDDRGVANKWAIRPIPGYVGAKKATMGKTPAPGLAADVTSTPLLPGAGGSEAADTIQEIMAELARRQKEETVLSTDTLPGYTPIKLRPRTK